jgi:hypothetical protein
MLRIAPLALALLLAACGDNQPAVVNEGGGDAGLAQENVIPGDVTAIDAATADDARMAADLAPPADNFSNLSENEAVTNEN